MKENKALSFLKNFPLPSGWRFKQDKNRGPVLWTKEGLGFSLDFSKNKRLSRRQPLFKALGFKGSSISILDITAGWAKEAFLLAQTGCDVTAVESHPFVFYFVQESLHFQGEKPEKLNLVLDNSFNYLNNLKKMDKPDLIYMDPMFGAKKSLSPKPLRILKKLAGEAKEKEALFKLALQQAQKRVVVKRHRLDLPFPLKSLCSFKGRSVCYDVFTAGRRRPS